MSIDTASCPHDETTPIHAEPLRLWSFREQDEQTLRPLLVRVAADAANVLGGARCTIQLFESLDSLRTLAASNLPDGTLWQTRFPIGVGVAGLVAQIQAPLIVGDLANDPRPLVLGRDRGGALMCAPIADDAHIYGTFTARSAESGAFDVTALTILRAYASSTAHAIDQTLRAAMHAAMARRNATLLALTRVIASCEDPHRALDLVLPQVAAVVHFDFGLLVADEEQTPQTRTFAPDGEVAEHRGALRQWALETHARHKAISPYTPHLPPIAHILDGYMVYAIPIYSAQTYLGFACFFRTAPFDAEEQQMLRDCCDVIRTAAFTAVLFRRLLQEKQRFEAVFTSTTDGMVLLDETGTQALAVNAACYTLTESSPSAMRFPTPVAQLTRQWAGTLHATEPAGDGTPRRLRLEPTSESGRHVEITETAISIGPVPHRLWILHDTTEYHRTERARSEFLSIVSHELRSPLASVYGFIDMLLAETSGSLSPVQRDFLESAHLGTQQLIRLVNDIVGLVQLDLGRLVLECDAVDIGELVASVVQSLNPLTLPKKQVVTVELAATPLVVNADAMRVRQILTNLLINASKFSPVSSAIHVRVSRLSDEACISVRDHGPGIHAGDIAHIFDRFFKGKHAPQRDASGLGLGLAIVHQLVVSHGGRVWGESMVGEGSTFSFTLPLAKREPEHAER